MELSDNPRLAAFRVLDLVLTQKYLPEEALDSCGALLNPRDAALTTALVYEVLRHKSYLEGLIRGRLTQGRSPEELKAVLRLGLAQLFYFDRLGEHAVLMETVNLAKIVCPGRHGVVNAVLRGLLRDRDAGGPWPPASPASGDLAKDLAVEFSHPEWLTRRWLKQFGPEAIRPLLTAGNLPTPPTLRTNPNKISRDDFQGLLPFESQRAGYSPWGLRLKNFSGRPEEWPGYQEGYFALQDEASQLIGLLAEGCGPAILDACAGLGGKTMNLAAANPAAKITAWDKDPAKLELLKKEALRLGLETRVQTQALDLLGGPLPQAAFDLVVVDAPCSGLGVIRRRPDLKWHKDPRDISRLAAGQLRFLKASAPVLKPGGRLVYGVCSPNEEEGPRVIEKFLREFKNFKIAPPADWPEALRPLLNRDGHLLLLPHVHNTDGFFWARLQAI